jgi:hypothetical protein
MPFGQVLALFDSMLGYIKLTSPFGSGDDQPSQRGATAHAGKVDSYIGADEAGAFSKISPVISHANVVPRDRVPDDIKDLLDPNYSPHNRKA